MPKSSRAPQVVRFGAFEADLSAGELRKKGRKIRLQQKPFQLLASLLQRPGEMVTREELQETLWPADTFVVFDDNLNTAISKLREALGDSTEHPCFIETLPRRGYRFIAGVVEQATPAPRAQAGSLRWIAFALAMVLLVGGYFLRERIWPERIMLTVLPFENLSGDPEQDYFSDGLTEEMIVQLGQLRGGRLEVIALTTAIQYKDTDKSIDQIGRELSANYILKGSVRREADRVRISAQLIRVGDQTQLWSQTYDRELSGILILQSEVARAVAGEIKTVLTPDETTRLTTARPVNPEAYEAFLKGRHHLNKATPGEINRAIAYFNEAIEKDPDFGLPYASLADSYNYLGFVGGLAPREVFPRAKRAATRALEIDDSLAQAHAALGYTATFYDRDWAVAEQELQRAVELNPNSAQAHLHYSWYLGVRGRFEEARAAITRASELDPLSLIISANMSNYFAWKHDYDGMLEQTRKTLELEPNHSLGHLFSGHAYLGKGLYDDAIAEYEKAVEISGGGPGFKGHLGHAYALAGHKGKALEILNELKDLSKKQYVPSVGIALIFIGLGDTDQAFAWLEKAYEERDVSLYFIRWNHWFDPLRDDPRFQDLLRRMNFPE